MAEIDWTILGASQRGLAVEGKNDKTIIEGFLDAGERQSRWNDWRARLQVVATGKNDHVLRETRLQAAPEDIWGIIDRDWRTDQEVLDLEAAYPYLRVLPRNCIENYCVDPDDLLQLLPSAQLEADEGDRLRQLIEEHLPRWLRHGALSYVIYESGAYDFCRERSNGYPHALLGAPIDDDDEILRILDQFRSRLDPEPILRNCNERNATFEGLGVERYRRCISGKLFFNEVVVSNALNRVYPQQSRDAWITDLFANAPDCPDDLAQILSAILA